jgi:Heliorhodopsin
MIFLGWLMELLNPPDRPQTRWVPFVLGCVVGAAAWVAIAVQIGVSAGRGHAPPSFVYASGSGAGATAATANAGISG